MARSEDRPPVGITPDWPAPDKVKALTTTRQGGCSQEGYASFNLADHVNDAVDKVNRNRALLRQTFDLPGEPLWLKQVHGRQVVKASADYPGIAEADASWTTDTGTVCAVLTADCLPVLFSSADGRRVAAAHAGWRGLHAGILTSTVLASGIEPQDCLAWLGPAIGPEAFEVGLEVRQAFIDKDPKTDEAFEQKDESHWLCDIYKLARMELEQLGVTHIYGGGRCTFSDTESYYSYRRDGDTGRMASLIWIAE